MELIGWMGSIDRFDRWNRSIGSIGILDVIDRIDRIIRSMDVPIDRIIRSMDVPIDPIIRSMDARIDRIIRSIDARTDRCHHSIDPCTDGYVSSVRIKGTHIRDTDPIDPSTHRPIDRSTDPVDRPRRRRTIRFNSGDALRSSRLRRSAHADASRRPRARSRSTESIERIFSRRLSVTMLAAARPIAPFVAPLLPLAIPRNRRGLRRIRSKYADVAPVKPVTNADSFKGEFPERDVTGNSLMAHVGIVWAIVNRLLAAAAKIAKEQGDDAPEVLGLTMWALAFLLDQCTHLHIAGDETNERAADGNVMQRGHHNGIFPLAALAAGGGVVMGEKIPLWCENIPDHGFDTLGARVILNKAFIAPVFFWQTLHAFGAFGGERFGGGEKTPAPSAPTPTTTKKTKKTKKTTSRKASKKISAAAAESENATDAAAEKTSSFRGLRASFRAPAA